VARGFFRLLLYSFVLFLALFLTRTWWLPGMGYALIHDDGPAHADIAVILAGDTYGKRIVKGGELIAAGYVPTALVSGPPGFFGHHENDFAIPYAVEKGFPAAGFVAVPHEALSTRAEAKVMLAELRQRGIKSFLLVTSDYHTGRARRIFLAQERKDGGGPAMRVVAAPDQYFRADSWWHTREGQKVVFVEWSKTLATFLGM